MKFLVFAAAVVAAALSADPTTAPPTFNPNVAFDLLDANKDGKVEKLEYDSTFASYDANNDMLITASEFAANFVKTGMSVEGSVYVFYKIDQNDNQQVDSAEIDISFASFDLDKSMTIEAAEFNNVFKSIIYELSIAKAVGTKLDVLFVAADTDGSNSLNAVEFSSLLTPADTDGDDMTSFNEFKVYWMANTNEPENRTRALFNQFDSNRDGFIGGSQEEAYLFQAFDNFKIDGKVEKSEFNFAMLYFLHKVMDSLNSSPMEDLSADFNAIDVNADGHLDLAEFKAAYLSGDKDASGNVDLTEFSKQLERYALSDKGLLFLFFNLDKNDDEVIDETDIAKEFEKFDKNMDGMITFDEYETTEREYGVIIKEVNETVERLVKKIDEIDADGDGKLSFADAYKVVGAADLANDGIDLGEFQVFYQSTLGATANESANFFYYYDTDKNGKIEGDDEVNNIFSSFDINKDGVLSKDEYINALVYQAAYILKNRPAPAAATNSLDLSIEAAFKAADNNSDGVITKDEFAPAGEISITEFVSAYMAAGLNRTQSLYIFFRVDDNEDQKVSQTELEDTFDSIDGDDDGKITLPEYVSRANQTFAEIEEAVRIYPRIAALFMRADADSDGNLTRTEMRSLLSGADQDSDGLASEAEFKEFWRNNTGEPESRTDLLFGYIDLDSDGYFGNDLEPANLFDGFDYNDNDLVSSEEFGDSMLFLYARATRDLEMMNNAGQIIGSFF